jgi:hypothetical protein
MLARVLVVAAAACVAPGVSPGAMCTTVGVRTEGCSFKAQHLTGRKLLYAFHSRTEIYPAPGPDPAAPPPAHPERVYTTDLTLRLAVLGVDERGGASLALLVDRANLISNQGDVERAGEWTSDKAATAEAPAPTAGVEERLAFALARAAVRIDVRPDGTVSLVQGLEDAQEIAKGAGVEGSRLLGPLAAGADARTIALLFRADRPDDTGVFRDRAPGDTWEFADRVPMSNVGSLLLTTSLRLDSCSAGEATASGAVRTTVEPPRHDDGSPMDPDPARPALTVDAQTDSLSVTWDTTHGALKKRERTSYISMSASVGGKRQHVQTVKTVSRVELTTLTNP